MAIRGLSVNKSLPFTEGVRRCCIILCIIRNFFLKLPELKQILYENYEWLYRKKWL
jgi:hypothetical protein